VKPVALESLLKIIQIIVKYDFPISDICYAKSVLQYKNVNLDEFYSDLY
jgi:hypothetical protein